MFYAMLSKITITLFANILIISCQRPTLPGFPCPEADMIAGCLGATDCLYPHPSDCGLYVRCKVNKDGKTGTATVYECQPGLQWNDRAKVCDFPAASTCGSVVVTEQTKTTTPKIDGVCICGKAFGDFCGRRSQTGHPLVPPALGPLTGQDCYPNAVYGCSNQGGQEASLKALCNVCNHEDREIGRDGCRATRND